VHTEITRFAVQATKNKHKSLNTDTTVETAHSSRLPIISSYTIEAIQSASLVTGH